MRRSLSLRPATYTKSPGGCGPPTARDLPCSVVSCDGIPFPIRRGSSSRLLSRCFTSSVAFTNAEWLGSALSLSGRLSTLQDSLHGTDYHLAPPSRRSTSLQHLQSPGSTGSLLRGSLAITTTGLAPASRRRLSRHTSKRSLRIEYSLCSNCGRNSFSGGIDGRPALAYIVSNRRHNWVSTSSTMSRMARKWSVRSRISGDKQMSIWFLLRIGSAHAF